MSRSVKQTLFGLCLRASAFVLGFAGADLIDGGLCWLQSLRGSDLQTSQAIGAHAVGYQVGGENKDGLAAILGNPVGDSVALDGSFCQPDIENRLAGIAHQRIWANECERGALVLKVRDERDFYFTVLVAQDHGLLNPSGAWHFIGGDGIVIEHNAMPGVAFHDANKFSGTPRCNASGRLASRNELRAVAGVDQDLFTAGATLDKFFRFGGHVYNHHAAINAQQQTPRNTRAALSSSSTTAEHVQPIKKGVIA